MGLADMYKRGNGYGIETRVNILKTVKVDRNWNLYPAVVEPNGKLRDKVRIRGQVELHPERYNYIEWWQDGRKREQIKDRAKSWTERVAKLSNLKRTARASKPFKKTGTGKGL